MEQKWVLMVTAKTPTNMSVIKYWGKRDEELILAMNESISVTFDPTHLCTTTTVAVSPVFDRDRMWLNGKEMSLSGRRYQNCLREIRARASDVEDETKVFALAKLMNVQEDNGKLSAIARQGSGSACRSLHGGFVKWVMGKEEDGSDSIAVQLVDEKYWDDLVIIIAVVSSQQKETSSSSGMLQTVETSTLMEYRAKEVVPKRVIEMEEAIKNRDFPTFARLTCAENNQFHAICLDTSPPIFYMNDTSHRIISCVEKWNRSVGTPQAAYTCDAGPNVVLLARDREAATLLLRRLLFHFPPNSTDIDSYVVGDKHILKDAGIQNIKDVESLPPPPEIEDDVLNYKYKGEIRYFICTRPGKGAVLLTDESQALLDPKTGLPK